MASSSNILVSNRRSRPAMWSWVPKIWRRKKTLESQAPPFYNIRGQSSSRAMDILAQKLDEECPSSKFYYEDDEDGYVDSKADSDEVEVSDEDEQSDSDRPMGVATTPNVIPPQQLNGRNVTFSTSLTSKKKRATPFLRPPLPSQRKSTLSQDDDRNRLLLQNRRETEDPIPVQPYLGASDCNPFSTMRPLVASDSASIQSLQVQGIQRPTPSSHYRSRNNGHHEQRDEEDERKPQEKESVQYAPKRRPSHHEPIQRRERSMREERDSPQGRRPIAEQRQQSYPSSNVVVHRSSSMQLETFETKNHPDTKGTAKATRYKGQSKAQELLKQRITTKNKFGTQPHSPEMIHKPLRANVIQAGYTV